MEYFLGIDIGGTKSQAVIATRSGKAIGFGHGGAGNWEDVGYAGLRETLQAIARDALVSAGITRHQITGAGFGIAGYDWNSQRAPHMEAISSLGLENARIELVNDTLIGMIAGSAAGWGIAIVAGTRANCMGRDLQGHIGRMTGYGPRMGEVGGGLEIAGKAVEAVAKEWSRRGAPTRLTRLLLERTGARDVEDFLEGVSLERIRIDASAAPLVFQAANEGDGVAIEIMMWAGKELAELAKGVIRQLHFEQLEFDAVLIGSIHRSSALLAQTMQDAIRAFAPGARFVPLGVPAAIGGVLLAMQITDNYTVAARETLIETIKQEGLTKK
jgi:N-acetylglucosamine kinase-like BadF-type ATPase